MSKLPTSSSALILTFIIAGLQMIEKQDLYVYYGQNILFQSLAYPFLTV